MWSPHMRRLYLTTGLCLTLSCTRLMNVGMNVGPTFVHQHTLTDCAIASLAMAADTTYRQADRARLLAHVDTERFGGTPLNEIPIIGHVLGLTLDLVSDVNPVTDEGILVIAPTPGVSHAVFLRAGLVYDPADSAPVAWVIWDHEQNHPPVIAFLRSRHPHTIHGMAWVHGMGAFVSA